MNNLALQPSMDLMKRMRCVGRLILLSWLCLTANHSLAAATNVLAWGKDRVTADVHDWELIGLLEEVASQTG